MSLLESVPLREWGTRYDSLSTSPTPSTASSLSRLPQPTTCPPTANSSLVTPVAVSPTKSRAQGNRLLHEASVFVGSLPTNVDHEELSSRLKNHLSVYGDVNFVRIIRDSRGGICAFVQCNDSASAAQLLQTVRSRPPQSFMGRYLRFEPARSQRTLWISYRKPTEVISDAELGRSDPSFNSNGRVIEFDLPNAMRICRAPGSRRVTILYNAQAVHFPGIVTTSHSPQEQDLDPSAGLFLSPLQFDSQTLEQIAARFGPLESFDLRQPEHTEDAQEYSYPHNADRSEGMDPGCWEIKWENRNDCLNALATLRSVPHFTVTWPNQQHALMPRRTGTFNRSHNVKDHLAVKRQSGPQHGQLRRDNDHNVIGQNFTALDSASSWTHSVNTAVAAVGFQASSEHLSPPNNGDPPISTDDWAIIDACVNADFQVRATFPDAAASNQSQASRVHRCDIPPETEDSRERHGDALCLDGEPSSQVSNLLEWSEAMSDPAKGDVATPSLSSPLHLPGHCGDTQSPPLGSVAALTTPFVENLASPFIQRSPRPASPNVGSALNFYNTFAIPPAIEWPETRLRGPSAPCDENIDVNLRNIPNQTTIFVGGLEVHGHCTWDEERLKRIFGQYGEIVEVKLVRPAHRKSAFAFVTYKSNKSSSQAVLAEHDRIYDGRHIRVQLRDNAVQKVHGSKSSVKSSEGREGRPFSPRHQFISRINSSPAGTLPPVQNSIGLAIPVPYEEPAPSLPLLPNGAASVHPDTRGQVPENTCIPLVPSQASSTMVSCVPPMTYPRPPPTAFYAPAPWFMHPYSYGPPPPIVPGYPPAPLTSPVVSTNETGRPFPSNTIYQPIPHYSVYPLPLHSIHATRQQNVEPAGLSERRAPLQPTGFIESEQGLIPVYAPEALGEYMASTHSHQNTPEPGGSHSGLHPPRAVFEARSLQPKTIHATYPQPQYHPAFIRDRSAIMMTAPGQFHNAPNLLSVGTGFNWYHDTSHPERRAQDGHWVAAAPTAQIVGNRRDIPMGQTPRSQIYSEHGFGFSKRRGQIDHSTPMRASTKGENPPGVHTTRRRGYLKHTWGAVSMSAVTDQTAEMGVGDGASISDPVVRASTSSPAVFDLTPTSPTQGTQM